MTETTFTTPRISVVVPTRCRKKLLLNCLNSLLTQDYPKDCYEIVVVEDGSYEGEAVIQSLPTDNPRVTYIHNSHAGAATTYDTGLQHARYPIVAFIDDDAMAQSNWLRELAAKFSDGQYDDLVGVGGRISTDYPEEEMKAQLGEVGELLWAGFHARLDRPVEVDFLPGANMAFRRDALIQAGGFDRKFSKTISWRHETDICLRLRLKGYRLLFDPELAVLHRAARWRDPLERLRPGVVWAMTRDDAYFRAKNYGRRGVKGAVLAALRDSQNRIVSGFANLFLVFVHLFGWIPGAWLGLRKKDRQLGSLRQR